VLGFLGPNGAGKSTTMKMIAGFITPTAGRASICGADIGENPIAAKRHLGYLPEGAPAYPDMTARAFLAFIARLRRCTLRQVDDVVERLGLREVLEQPIDTLSKGFKRRVGLAQALLHDPEVLILDEPTDGLDPNQKHEVRRLITEIAADKAIIISTHILEEVDAVCTRAIIIASGRLLADGTPAEFEARSRHHHAVRLTIAGDPAEQAASLLALPEIQAVEAEEGCLMIFPRNGALILGMVSDFARARGWNVTGLALERGRLDDVFRDITRAA